MAAEAETWAGWVLAAGVRASAALLAAGLLVPGEWGEGLLRTGLTLLIATPAARVFSLAAGFLRRGERDYAAASAAVLALMGLSAALG